MDYIPFRHKSAGRRARFCLIQCPYPDAAQSGTPALFQHWKARDCFWPGGASAVQTTETVYRPTLRERTWVTFRLVFFDNESDNCHSILPCPQKLLMPDFSLPLLPLGKKLTGFVITELGPRFCDFAAIKSRILYRKISFYFTSTCAI